MSDNIPFDIQVDIIKRLPINSLIRFRSVSKPWKTLIDSSEFITGYHVHHSPPRRLLVSYRDLVDSELKYVSIDDDDTFPQRKCSLNVPKFIKNAGIVGSSQGLLCLYQYDDIVVLCNPSIRKSLVVKLPKDLFHPYCDTVVGFGVCPNSNDPKLVKIKFIMHRWEIINCIPSQVEVFTLSSRAWRIPLRNLPRKSIGFGSHIVTDRFIYWMAFDTSMVDYSQGDNMIISFDLTSEEFREIHFPDSLAHSEDTLDLSMIGDSLVVLELSVIDDKLVYSLWYWSGGAAPNSFSKLVTVDAPNASLNSVLGFRENSQPIVEISENSSATLAVSEHLASLRSKDLGIYGCKDSFMVCSYKETLMLLDQPDCSTYSNV